jgi:SAM-dependent methyltransferase
MKSFLHVLSGGTPQSEIQGFNVDDWQEVRLDNRPGIDVDIEGSIHDLSKVPTASVDAVYSFHNIVYLYAHEVVTVLKEFKRVLKEDGIVVLSCPDLQSTCEAIVADKLLDPLFNNTVGTPIAPIDILYGIRGNQALGITNMAHKCGFTYSSLLGVFSEAGFASFFGGRRPSVYDLWNVAFVQEKTEQDMRSIGRVYIPLQ